MKPYARNSPAAVSRVVALTMMADASFHPRELAALDEMAPWRELGISREGFLSVASETFADLMCDMRTRDRLTLLDEQIVNAMLDAVDDPDQRALAYRLAVVLLPADGQLAEPELALLQRMLDRWKLPRATVEGVLAWN
jgi:hypothetical protein